MSPCLYAPRTREEETVTQEPQANGISNVQFDSINETIEAFRKGYFIIVLDAPSRENEGDLIIAAQDVTTDKMAFMIRHTSGLVCAPVSSSLTSALALPQMVACNTEVDGTAYTVSVDAAVPSMTTGISAHDRAMTCRMLAEPKSSAIDFRRPGHVFPLQARDGGVRERKGHTEATIEFCRLSGKRHAGALCELVRDGEKVEGRTERRGGGMMRGAECLRFGKKWGIKVCTIEDLVGYLDEQDLEDEVRGCKTNMQT
ncbi:MAG: hypothetical protein LQ342_005849 [Letrouitia transgressa]|nr:MAG: hypothetical protein LQ342_005849 [Letrouitia transgressa]